MNLAAMLTAAVCLGNLATAVIPAAGQEYGTIRLVYEEDGSPISGAGFTFYKVGTVSTEVQNGTISDEFNMILSGIPENSLQGAAGEYLEMVQKAYETETIEQGAVYSGITDSSGVICIDSAETGIYLAAETSPAVNHLSSGAFFFRLPYMEEDSSGTWKYEVQIQPKPVPTGELQIEKEVLGAEGEYDRAFHVSVNLDDTRQRTYTYWKSDGSTGDFSSGDSFLLKHHESVRITGIPDGTAYTVAEKEADTDGYMTYITRGIGRIQRYMTTRVTVKNSRNVIPLTSDRENLRVYKAILALNAGLIIIMLAVHRLSS